MEFIQCRSHLDLNIFISDDSNDTTNIAEYAGKFVEAITISRMVKWEFPFKISLFSNWQNRKLVELCYQTSFSGGF